MIYQIKGKGKGKSKFIENHPNLHPDLSRRVISFAGFESGLQKTAAPYTQI